MTSIENKIDQEQFGDVKDYCHALKGNSLSVGATAFSASIEKLSKISASTSEQEIKKRFNEITNEFSQLKLAIEGYLTKPEVASK